MTRLSVPSEDVLGENYKITNITASNYNPTIDSTITVTITVNDVYGDEIENDYVTITCNVGKFTKLNGSTISDTQSVTAQTDSNGEISLTYTCSEWGLVTFSANNTNIQVKTKGWKEATLPSAFGDSQLFYNDTDVEFHIRCTLSNITNTGIFLTAFSQTLPDGYKPSLYVVGSSDRDATVFFRVNTGGTVHYKALSTVSGSYEYRATLRWKR